MNIQFDEPAAASSAILETKQFEADRSLTARLRRRTLFFVRYLSARARSRTIAKLLPILEDSFQHPWVARIELRLRPQRGKDGEWPVRRLWPSQSLPLGLVHWDAPITICVFRRKKGKERPALCMSLYVDDGTVSIVQLQGVPRTDPPKEVRLWPIKFIEACQKFVLQENLKGVRVAKANSLYSYRSPTLNPELAPVAREEALQRIRKTMEALYDANALAVGFVPEGDWLKWENSKRPAHHVG